MWLLKSLEFNTETNLTWYCPNLVLWSIKYDVTIILTSNFSRKRKNIVRNYTLRTNISTLVGEEMEFLKRGFNNGVAWANDAFHIPQITKKDWPCLASWSWRPLRYFVFPPHPGLSLGYPDTVPRKQLNFFYYGVCLLFLCAWNWKWK